MTKMVKIAILTTLASLYACSLDSVSDIRSADSAIDDPFDKVATPQPITGSFLTYDNARIYCNPSSGEGSLEFQVQCHAAIMDTITGKEVLALGIAKDTAIIII